MSTLEEKLERPTPSSPDRVHAQATLAQIYKMWGAPIVTKSDVAGSPMEITRRDLEGNLERWERRGHGKDAYFEKVEG